jgi:hypothetical protein
MLPIESAIRTQLHQEERHREAHAWRAHFRLLQRSGTSGATNPETPQRRRNPVALKPTPSLDPNAFS